MPACCTTLAQRAISEFTKRCYSAGAVFAGRVVSWRDAAHDNVPSPVSNKCSGQVPNRNVPQQNASPPVGETMSRA